MKLWETLQKDFWYIATAFTLIVAGSVVIAALDHLRACS